MKLKEKGEPVETLARFLAGLLPEHDADPEEHYRYMLRLGLTVSGLVIGFAILSLADYGMMPGVAGFAKADAFQEVVGEIRANRSQELQVALLSLQTKACQTKSDEARQLYDRLILQDENEYNYLNKGAPYSPLACSQL
jgi:hypothetical protein